MSPSKFLLRLLIIAALTSATAQVWGQRIKFPTPVNSEITPITEEPAEVPKKPAFAQFNGRIAEPSFDAYSTQGPTIPFTGQNGAVVQGTQPTQPFGQIPEVQWPGMSGVQGTLRNMQGFNFHHAWMYGRRTVTELGVNESEISATFRLGPIFYNRAPLLLTPGFGLHLWNGPPKVGPNSPDMPSKTYDAYLDVAWQPPLTQWVRLDLGVRTGVYTDFDQMNSQSVRYMGRGFAVFQARPNVEFWVGVMYLDRLDVKLLPGGIIWTPHENARYELFFPRPKLSRKWFETANARWWAYIQAEYGGGTWTVNRTLGGVPLVDQADYNDYRVMVGLERFATTGGTCADHASGTKLYIEAGYVFRRELIYRSGSPALQPNDTMMLRGGFRY